MRLKERSPKIEVRFSGIALVVWSGRSPLGESEKRAGTVGLESQVFGSWIAPGLVLLLGLGLGLDLGLGLGLDLAWLGWVGLGLLLVLVLVQVWGRVRSFHIGRKAACIRFLAVGRETPPSSPRSSFPLPVEKRFRMTSERLR